MENKKNLIYPVAAEGIVWQTSQTGAPGKLTFALPADEKLILSEGSRVFLKCDGKPVFVGYLFEWETTKNGLISVIAYDQIRYLKNKDSYVFTNATATEIIRRIAGDFQLRTGEMDDTAYKIESYTADCKPLLDMIEEILSLTRKKSGRSYILYDDCGAICLKNRAGLALDILIDAQCGEGYHYASSIDKNTYNKIKLIHNNKKKRSREVFLAKDEAAIKQWGVLQYCETISEAGEGKEQANVLLSGCNQKTESLTLYGVFGDIRVRAGCSLRLKIDDASFSVRERLLCDTVKHQFFAGRHVMDITLKGGRFG